MEKQEAKARKLLDALERIIDDSEAIINVVDRCESNVKVRVDLTEEQRFDELLRTIIDHYAMRLTLSGGATALPALLPGVGIALALGGSLVDMTLMLKYEIEMAMALSHVFDFDIRDAQERQVAWTMATSSTADVQSGSNLVADLLTIEREAIGHYAPRQLSKLLLSGLVHMLLLPAVRRYVRLLPLVGVVVGAGYNNLMTKRIGEKCIEVLRARKKSRDASVVVSIDKYQESKRGADEDHDEDEDE